MINNSRFLILPTVKVENLASNVLALSAKQIVVDWPSQFNIVPVLLETFVENSRFKGTSYRAANWLYLGQTKALERRDKDNRKSVSVTRWSSMKIGHPYVCWMSNVGHAILTILESIIAVTNSQLNRKKATNGSRVFRQFQRFKNNVLIRFL